MRRSTVTAPMPGRGVSTSCWLMPRVAEVHDGATLGQHHMLVGGRYRWLPRLARHERAAAGPVDRLESCIDQTRTGRTSRPRSMSHTSLTGRSEASSASRRSAATSAASTRCTTTLRRTRTTVTRADDQAEGGEQCHGQQISAGSDAQRVDRLGVEVVQRHRRDDRGGQPGEAVHERGDRRDDRQHQRHVGDAHVLAHRAGGPGEADHDDRDRRRWRVGRTRGRVEGLTASFTSAVVRHAGPSRVLSAAARIP